MKFGIERILERACVFKGGGGGAVPMTGAEKENTRIAVEKWNHYLRNLKPSTDEFVKEVRSDVGSRVDSAQGMASADIHRKGMTVDPNRGVTAVPAISRATKMATAGLAAETGAHTQQAAGEMSLLDVGAGKEATASMGMAQLAEDAAKQARAEDLAEFNDDQATTSSLMSGAGGMAALYLNKKPAQ